MAIEGAVLAALLGSGIGLSALGGNILTSQANAYTNYYYNKQLMNHSYDLNQRSLRESPTSTRAGLESAGYNPLVAFGSSISSPTTNASGINVSESQSGTNAGRLYLEKLQTAANIKATNAQAVLSEQQALTEGNKRSNLDSQTLLNNINEKLGQKDLNWYDRRTLTELQTKIIEAQAQRMGAQASVTNAQAAMKQADTSAKWTPIGIGAGLGAGLLGFGIGKIPGLKYLKKKKVGF